MSRYTITYDWCHAIHCPCAGTNNPPIHTSTHNCFVCFWTGTPGNTRRGFNLKPRRCHYLQLLQATVIIWTNGGKRAKESTCERECAYAIVRVNLIIAWEYASACVLTREHSIIGRVWVYALSRHWLADKDLSPSQETVTNIGDGSISARMCHLLK